MSTMKCTDGTSGTARPVFTIRNVNALGELLAAQARRLGSVSAVAKALGISPSRLSRVGRGDYSLEVVNCLKLAQLSGEPATEVLRAAGKGDVADLLESQFGKGRPQLPASHRLLLEKWETIPPSVREHFLVLIDHAAAGAAQVRAQEKRRKSA